MSKHKKHKVEIRDEKKQPEQGNNPNLDLNGLSSLLNNVDMSQLSEMMGNLGLKNNEAEDTETVAAPQNFDKRVEVLSALRPMLDSEKTQILDTIIQLYGISRILKKK